MLVPEYVIDNRVWFDDHYEGGHLFREKVNFELTGQRDALPHLKYGFDRPSPNGAQKLVPAVPKVADGWDFRVPIGSKTRPGLKGSLVISSNPWQ